MIIQLDVLDHAILDEKNKCMIMLIIDSEDIWELPNLEGVSKLKKKKMVKDKNLEHLVCLNKKVENYIIYIQNNGIMKSFPNCDAPESYSYEIRVISNFQPSSDYLELINRINKYIKKTRNDIYISNEICIK